MMKKAGLGAGAGSIPAPQSSAPTLMVHIPNSDLEDARVEGDEGRDGASSGDAVSYTHLTLPTKRIV